MSGVHRADLLAVLADTLPPARLHTGHRPIASFGRPTRRRRSDSRTEWRRSTPSWRPTGSTPACVSRSPRCRPCRLRLGGLPRTRPGRARALVAGARLPALDRRAAPLPGRFRTSRDPRQLRGVRAGPREGRRVLVRGRGGGEGAQGVRHLRRKNLTTACRGGDHEMVGRLRPRSLDTWTAGRLTFLGDVAHRMLSHLEHGANQSIEDAFVSRSSSAPLTTRACRTPYVTTNTCADLARPKSSRARVTTVDAPTSTSTTLRSAMQRWRTRADFGCDCTTMTPRLRRSTRWPRRAEPPTLREE